MSTKRSQRTTPRWPRAGHRRAIAALLALGLLAVGPRTASAQDAGRAGVVVYRVPVTGVIDLGLAPFIERSLREAEEAGAVAAVLEIRTLGGRVDAAQRIIDAVADTEIPVYAFVDERALSAGAMIALSTDRIYMRPGSVLGAATPVTGQGQKASEKVVSMMRAEMRALAEDHGLDPRVAEAMVDESIEVAGVVEAGKLLTLTTDQAVEIGYADEAADWDGLLAAIGAPEAVAYATDANWAEGLVRWLTHPLVAPFMLSIGFLGLLIELKTPTFGLAGAVGALSLAAFFGSHLLVGLAGWEELILLGAGVALLGVEIFIVPGFGFFGIAGIVGILASIYLSLLGQFATGADYGQAAGVLSATVLFVLVAGWALIRTLPQNRRLVHSGVLLGEVAERDTGYVSAVARADLIGVEGVVLTDLRPAGVAEFGDERVDVVAEGGWIEAGSRVRVLRSEGYRVVVRSVEAPAADPVAADEPAASDDHASDDHASDDHAAADARADDEEHATADEGAAAEEA